MARRLVTMSLYDSSATSKHLRLLVDKTLDSRDLGKMPYDGASPSLPLALWQSTYDVPHDESVMLYQPQLTVDIEGFWR